MLETILLALFIWYVGIPLAFYALGLCFLLAARALHVARDWKARGIWGSTW